jgi:alpha-D-ribose 1-methylphosphonate 5-triphosphate diphosphatase PhnM
MSMILSNTRVVTADAVVHGAVRVANGRIAEVIQDAGSTARRIWKAIICCPA